MVTSLCGAKCKGIHALLLLLLPLLLLTIVHTVTTDQFVEMNASFACGGNYTASMATKCTMAFKLNGTVTSNIVNGTASVLHEMPSILSEPPYLHNINQSCISSTEWPHLEFFLPMHLSHHAPERNNEWRDIFMRSVLLFWPIRTSNVTLRILLNEELRNESTLIKNHIIDYVAEMRNLLGKDFPWVEITYHAPVYLNKSGIPPNNVTVYESGHDRQQYMMLYADRMTNSEYVAFVDTDTFFHSYVDSQDLFERGKPIIHGTIKRYRKAGPDVVRKKWADSTHAFLGDEEPMICMSYFPLIFRTRDLQKLRSYVEKKFSVPFDEVFHNVNKGR